VTVGGLKTCLLIWGFTHIYGVWTFGISIVGVPTTGLSISGIAQFGGLIV